MYGVILWLNLLLLRACHAEEIIQNVEIVPSITVDNKTLPMPKVVNLSSLHFGDPHTISNLTLTYVVIADANFSGLYRLSQLNILVLNEVLESPRIRHSFFTRFPKLEQFIVQVSDDNAAVEFEENAFDHAKNLKMLEIERLPFIFRLTKRFLRGLENLEHLRLDKGYIEYIEDDAFERITKLKFLSLGYNAITSIEPGTFRYLKQLDTLYLDGNKLLNFSWNIFDGLTNLQTVAFYDVSLVDLRKSSLIKRYLPAMESIEVEVDHCENFVGLSKNYGGYEVVFTNLNGTECR